MTIYANLSDLLSDILNKKVRYVNRKKEDERGLASSCENIQVIFEVTFTYKISKELKYIYTYIVKDGSDQKMFLKIRKSGSQTEVRN